MFFNLGFSRLQFGREILQRGTYILEMKRDEEGWKMSTLFLFDPFTYIYMYMYSHSARGCPVQSMLRNTGMTTECSVF